MHPDLKTVIELQQVDAGIAEFTTQILALPSQIQTLEAQLNEFLHAHEEHKQRLSANQKERRELEGETQVIQTKIARHKDQLYQVKTNEQYRALLHEISIEEENIRKIEDKILSEMLEAEELQKLVSDAAARLDGEKKRVAIESERLTALRNQDLEQRTALEARRAALATSLTRSVLDTYERVRKSRHGVGLAEVRDGFCMGCHVGLRPQLYNEVRLGESVIACENCQRILYYVEPQSAEAEGGSEAANRAAITN